MGHYAFIDENNIVVEVITGKDENEIVDGISDWELHYEQYRPGLRCKRTSYNTLAGQHNNGGTAFRKNYAGIGYTYDEQRDAFIPPQQFSKWVLNEETCCWESPIPYPDDELIYVWNDNQGEWEELIDN
jgi:hypothetical protein